MKKIENYSEDKEKIEKALKENQSFIGQILATTPNLIYVYDLNRKCNVYTNHEILDFLGYTSEEIKNMGNEFLKNILHPEDMDRVIEHHKNMIAAPDEEIYSIEYRMKHSDGSLKWICSRDNVFKRNSEGMAEQILGTAIDITEIKTAEEEKEKMEKQLRQAQKMESIGTLAGGIAHDFNNILGTIISYSELGLNTISDELSVKNSLEGIIRAGNRAKDIIRQIITFSRQTDIELKPVSLGEIIKETLPLIRSSLPSTIKIKTLINTDGIVMADHAQISQILLNLCSNAMDSMIEHGGVLEINLSRLNIMSEHTDLKPGDYIVLTVTDTGHGMEKDILERIFDPFFTTKNHGKGSGMGLSVVHGIVKSHGGIIKVWSKPKKGSSFQISIPEFHNPVHEKEILHESVPSGKENILFIDDEEDLLFSQGQMLKFQGYNVTTTTSSMEALKTFQENPCDFDLIITDQTMPDMTGIEIVKKILHIRPGMPVILCTGYSEKSIEDEAKSLGIKYLITKPVTAKNFAKIIRNVLGQ